MPAILAVPVPMFVPTGERANIGFPRLPLGKSYNRSTYRLVNGLMRLSAGKYVREWRREHGLPRRRLDLLHGPHGRPAPVIHAHSEHVLPRPADWPANAIVTGYWFLGSEETWRPGPALADFLNAGPPPLAADEQRRQTLAAITD